MKQLTKALTYKTFVILLILSLFQAIAWAQDSAVSSSRTTTTTEQTTWYTQPWVWVVGGAVFLLLIVALVRSNSSSGTSNSRTDKVTYTKTTETDNP